MTYLRRHLGESRFVTLGPIEPNYGSYFRLASVRVDGFPPDDHLRYVHGEPDPCENFVGFQPPGYRCQAGAAGLPARDRASALVPTARRHGSTA